MPLQSSVLLTRKSFPRPALWWFPHIIAGVLLSFLIFILAIFKLGDLPYDVRWVIGICLAGGFIYSLFTILSINSEEFFLDAQTLTIRNGIFSVTEKHINLSAVVSCFMERYGVEKLFGQRCVTLHTIPADGKTPKKLKMILAFLGSTRRSFEVTTGIYNYPTHIRSLKKDDAVKLLEEIKKRTPNYFI